MWHTDGMHSLTLGDFELRAFSDGFYQLDGGAFFGVVPKVTPALRKTLEEALDRGP